MTIQAPTARVSFACNGTSTVFPVNIQAYLATDFLVILTNTASGLSTNLVLNSDYTLVSSGSLAPTFWTLTTTLTYATGNTLQTILNPTVTQLTQYTQGQAFPTLAVQTNLDRLTQIDIRDQDEISRCIQAPDGDVSPVMLLPAAGLRRSTNLGFDVNGNVALNLQLLSGTLSTATLAPFLGLSQTPAEAAAGVTPTLFYIARYKDVPVERYGVTISNTAGTETANTAGMNQAIAVAAAVGNTGGVLYMPEGTIRINGSLNMGTNQVNFQGSGKGQTFLKAIGFSSDQPILNFQGTSGTPIDSIFVRNFALASDNNLARGISATWVKNSAWDDLYFFQLLNGWVGATSFGSGFRNNNAFQVTTSTYVLGSSGTSGGCSNSLFEKCRMVGSNGISINFAIDTVAVKGCDFEGITGNGAGIIAAPPTGSICSAISVEGSHFENINGTAIYMAGTDANSIINLVVKDNFLKGGWADSSNTFALNAILLAKVNGFDISDNDFVDWGRSDADATATNPGFAVFLSGVAGNAVNGSFERNRSAQSTVGGGAIRTLKNSFDLAPDKTVRVAKNWVPANGLAYSGSQDSSVGQSGISGTATAANNLRGTASFAAGTSIAVTFPTAEPDASYFVSVTFTSDPGSTNTRYWVSGKGTSGFTVNVPVATSASFDWHLIR